MIYRVDGGIVLPRTVEGPLIDYLVPFSRWLDEQGYAAYSSYRKVLLASYFSSWLKTRDVALKDLTASHATRYLRARACKVIARREDRFTLSQLLDHLRQTGAIARPEPPARRQSPMERVLSQYEQHLRDDRALAVITIAGYVPFARDLLTERFAGTRFCLGSLSGSDLIDFVRRRAHRMSIKRAKLMTTALRSFVRYLRFRGAVTQDLADAIPSVAGWTMSAVPRGISSVDSQTLLASIDRRTAAGRRDYAMLLLFARLGLRLSEVLRLELDDIDWADGTLSYGAKGGKRRQLPIPDDVGAAIAAYLQQGRPECACRRVFLRHRAPIGGLLSPGGIDSMIGRRIQHAGIDTPTRGAHQFRHALATQMLRRGSSLEQIGDVLGHRSIETTRIYAKVDVDALRTLALPWPGGVQ